MSEQIKKFRTISTNMTRNTNNECNYIINYTYSEIEREVKLIWELHFHLVKNSNYSLWKLFLIKMHGEEKSTFLSQQCNSC